MGANNFSQVQYLKGTDITYTSEQMEWEDEEDQSDFDNEMINIQIAEWNKLKTNKKEEK